MLQTMEMMKVFFDIPGVTFVVGISRVALLEAVAAHYGEDFETDSIVRADLYPDKIFQIGVSVHVSTLKLLEVFLRPLRALSATPSRSAIGCSGERDPSLTAASSNTS